MTLPALSTQSDNYLFVTGGMGSLGTFQQFATSNTLFTVDYSEFLAADETLTGVGFSVSPDTTPPIAVSDSNLVAIAGVANKGVSFLCGGGVVGSIYQFGLVATTSLGQNRADTLNLQITFNSNGVASAASYWPYGVGWPAGYVPSTGGMTPIGETGGGGGGGGGSENFAVARLTVNTSAITACAARSGRFAATVKNLGLTNIEVSPAAGFTFGTGIPIGPGEAITIDTQAVVYVVSDAGGGLIVVEETY